jgi:hypothetical protein
MGKSFLLFLALSLLPLHISYSDEAREIIQELMQINQDLEGALTLRDEAIRLSLIALDDKDRQLTELLTLLEQIKSESESIKRENELMMNENLRLQNFWKDQEKRETALRNSLTAAETERTLAIVAASVVAGGWLVDRLFIR